MINRLFYILYRILSDLVGLASRAINALVFQGSTAQTLSARAHIEASKSPFWSKMRSIINALFFWDEDHCASDWEREVERAKHTLSVLEMEK